MAEWLDALQWPAMLLTLVAAWLTGSQQALRRTAGFWCFVASNVVWVAWGWQAQAYALIALQFGLFGLNVRGACKNGGAQSGSDEAGHPKLPVGRQI